MATVQNAVGGTGISGGIKLGLSDQSRGFLLSAALGGH